ncbi:hypothetical protein CHU98_g7455, partial [Xylaria longipes]
IRGAGMGWPEIGYKLHPAHWGRGYATESMTAVLRAWWELPREEAEVTVHPGTLPQEKGSEGPIVSRERVVAEIAAYNAGSQRVLEKLGFEDFGSWEEPDTQLHRLGQPLMMGHYVLRSDVLQHAYPRKDDVRIAAKIETVEIDCNQHGYESGHSVLLRPLAPEHERSHSKALTTYVTERAQYLRECDYLSSLNGLLFDRRLRPKLRNFSASVSKACVYDESATIYLPLPRKTCPMTPELCPWFAE